MSKITPEARHRRQRETIQEQLGRCREEISLILDRQRKLQWALKLHDECEAQRIYFGDQGDIEFHLKNDEQ